MRRMIRVHVEILRPNNSTDYLDLPDGWDDLAPEEKGRALDEMAVQAMEEAVGSGACVVEVDEHGKEIRVLDEDTP